jgi:hypothetical protein
LIKSNKALLAASNSAILAVSSSRLIGRASEGSLIIGFISSISSS